MRRHGTTIALVALFAAACGGAAVLDDVAVSTPATSETSTSSTRPDTTTTLSPSTEESHMGDDMRGAVDEGAAADVTFEVTMSEFAFEPTSFEIEAGQIVTFVIRNEGAIEHEFRASNSHRIEEHIAAGHVDHGSEAGHHEGGDIVVLVQPGGTEELTVSFPDDMAMYTEIVCLLPGHYEAGMTADLTYSSG